MYNTMKFELSLLRTITNDFSEEQRVGSGSFGEVYRVCMTNHFVYSTSDLY